MRQPPTCGLHANRRMTPSSPSSSSCSTSVRSSDAARLSPAAAASSTRSRSSSAGMSSSALTPAIPGAWRLAASSSIRRCTGSLSTGRNARSSATLAGTDPLRALSANNSRASPWSAGAPWGRSPLQQRPEGPRAAQAALSGGLVELGERLGAHADRQPRAVSHTCHSPRLSDKSGFLSRDARRRLGTGAAALSPFEAMPAPGVLPRARLRVLLGLIREAPSEGALTDESSPASLDGLPGPV
jgi:hypothetical protein